MFMCAFPPEIYSIFSKSFPFPFPYFVFIIIFISFEKQKKILKAKGGSSCFLSVPWIFYTLWQPADRLVSLLSPFFNTFFVIAIYKLSVLQSSLFLAMSNLIEIKHSFSGLFNITYLLYNEKTDMYIVL